MEPRIETITPKKIVGQRMETTLAKGDTAALWQRFMPRRREILNNISADLLSVEIYDPALDFKDFNPHTLFWKWAAVEVSEFENIPDGLETAVLPGGLYAVFLYQGDPRAFADTFNYIFSTWLPASDYVLDQRPHFEVMGARYKNNDPASEEEIWVPVKSKI